VTTARSEGQERLGARIRHHRRQLGLTLVEVADLAGISQPFLSQIERGKAAPSMSTLEGLAHALGTTQAHLLEAVNSPPGPADPPGPPGSPAAATGGRGAAAGDPVDVRRSTEGAILTRAEGTVGGHTRLLPGGPNDTQLLEFVETNHVPGRFFHHPGLEWLYVTRGTVLLEVGDSLTRLEAGDVARYDGELPHRWYVPEGEQACLIVARPG
jgi:transcriptional regulator with XRE-family HTH domain